MNDFERLVGFSRPHLLIENGKGYLSLNEIRLVSSRLWPFQIARRKSNILIKKRAKGLETF